MKGAKGHDVAHLAELVRSNNGPAFRSELLAEITCNASVRYDRTLVSVESARRAHAASLQVVGTIAIALRGLGAIGAAPTGSQPVATPA